KETPYLCFMEMSLLKDEFVRLYGPGGDEMKIYFAPGRVNLIGEHTDYNNGYVLPAALSFGTYLLVRPNGTEKIRLATTNFDYRTEIPHAKISEKHSGQWVNYPLGVMTEFIALGKSVQGMDMLYSGDIPAAAGLSSSASIELVTAVALNDIHGYGLSSTDLVHLCVRAERGFVGVQCGIMDQFIVGKGKAGAALFLDCATEEYRHVPFNPENYRLVIADTKKPRKLSDSKYNERVAQCREGVKAISEVMPINSLGELEPSILADLDDIVADPVVLKRVRHIVTENHRVLEAVNCLQQEDYVTFGNLMNASHNSLRDDYEVTGPELDAMVEASRRQAGVLGSRMTGAGFGGCTVSLVKRDVVSEFIREVTKDYHRNTGFYPDFYLPEISEGAGRIITD
ncbi:MAG TPA: galactokinase, partial [Bacteroidales bacterium]|nr:galactokinase [Bacteroidales bacterium]